MATRRRTKGDGRADKIDRIPFIDALTKVKPGLANKDIMEQSMHFIFDNDKIWTYNDHITIMHYLETGITGAIKAEEFYKLLNKIPDDVISISQQEGQLILKGKDIKASINIDPDIKIKPIAIPATNSTKWQTLPKDFAEAALFCVFSASQNIMIKPELTCLFITKDWIVSCDGFRGTKRRIRGRFKETYLLPADAAKELCKYNPHKIIKAEGWLHFINKENTIFSCRTYPDKEYPESIWDFFDIEGTPVELPEKFTKTIERAEVMITEDFDLDRMVTITMKDNTIVCKGKGSVGKYREQGKIDYDGEPIEIKVHPRLLSEILSRLNSMVISDRLLFKGEGFEHICCLSC